jgi:hypothetical protein
MTLYVGGDSVGLKLGDKIHMGKKNPSAAVTIQVEFLHSSGFSGFGDGGAVKVGPLLNTVNTSFEFFDSLLVPKPFVG